MTDTRACMHGYIESQSEERKRRQGRKHKALRASLTGAPALKIAFSACRLVPRVPAGGGNLPRMESVCVRTGESSTRRGRFGAPLPINSRARHAHRTQPRALPLATSPLRRLVAFRATMPPRLRGASGYRSVRERPNGWYSAEIRAGDVRLGLGTFRSTHEAPRAYDAWRGAWRGPGRR